MARRPTLGGLEKVRVLVKVHPLLLTAILAVGGCGAASPSKPTEPASKPASRPRRNLSANNLYRTPNDVHRLITEVFSDVCLAGAKAEPSDSPPKDALRREFTSPVIATEFAFNDLCPSWNIDVPDGAGFYVEIRVGRQAGDFWTPFYYLGGCGKFPAPERRVLKDP